MEEKIAEAFKGIQNRRKTWKNEEEVRIAWVKALEGALDMHVDAERLRNDSSINNVIFEFKAPGFFKGSTTSAKFKEATNERLDPNIRKVAKREGLQLEQYLGFAIDGEHIAEVWFFQGTFQIGALLPFDEISFATVVAACRANYRRALTADNLTDLLPPRIVEWGIDFQAALRSSLMLEDRVAKSAVMRS